MNKKQWSEATTSVFVAINGLFSAHAANKNAWIEIEENGVQEFPIKKKNPELDNPFNWAMSYGIPHPSKDAHYFNDTNRDLTENWVSCFGTKEAVLHYQETGEPSELLVCGMGVNTPVRKSDFRKMRPDLPANFNLWTYYWQPKDSIQYWVVDESIKRVFVVYYNNEPFDSSYVLNRLKEVINSIDKL